MTLVNSAWWNVFVCLALPVQSFMRAHQFKNAVRPLRNSVQVLQGLDDSDWDKIRQLVVEVHSHELRVGVEALARRHFGNVTVEQEARMHGTGLYLVRASRRPSGSGALARCNKSV